MEPTELPPLWALDMATRASGFDCSWQGYCDGQGYGLTHSNTLSIIAHARTLAAHPDIYQPVDPAELKRWQDAREAAAAHAESIAFPKGAREARAGLCDDDDNVRSAYIALCRRDGVEPQDKAPGA